MNATYRVIIEPDGKMFHGYVPALKGCHTWGKTMLETKQHLQEAIALYIETLVDRNESVPNEVSFESFTTVEIPKKSRKPARQYA